MYIINLYVQEDTHIKNTTLSYPVELKVHRVVLLVLFHDSLNLLRLINLSNFKKI